MKNSNKKDHWRIVENFILKYGDNSIRENWNLCLSELIKIKNSTVKVQEELLKIRKSL